MSSAVPLVQLVLKHLPDESLRQLLQKWLPLLTELPPSLQQLVVIEWEQPWRSNHPQFRQTPAYMQLRSFGPSLKSAVGQQVLLARRCVDGDAEPSKLYSILLDLCLFTQDSPAPVNVWRDILPLVRNATEPSQRRIGASNLLRYVALLLQAPEVANYHDSIQLCCEVDTDEGRQQRLSTFILQHLLRCPSLCPRDWTTARDDLIWPFLETLRQLLLSFRRPYSLEMARSIAIMVCLFDPSPHLHHTVDPPWTSTHIRTAARAIRDEVAGRIHVHDFCGKHAGALLDAFLPIFSTPSVTETDDEWFKRTVQLQLSSLELPSLSRHFQEQLGPSPGTSDPYWRRHPLIMTVLPSLLEHLPTSWMYSGGRGVSKTPGSLAYSAQRLLPMALHMLGATESLIRALACTIFRRILCLEDESVKKHLRDSTSHVSDAIGLYHKELEARGILDVILNVGASSSMYRKLICFA